MVDCSHMHDSSPTPAERPERDAVAELTATFVHGFAAMQVAFRDLQAEIRAERGQLGTEKRLSDTEDIAW